MPTSDGQTFGKYQLLDRLAVGGMAEIWRARLTGAAGITKPVVIKKVLPAYARDPGFVAMFKHEATITLGLSHGNIAQVFDFGEVDGEYYLAMEHVHGHPLSRVLRRVRERGLLALPVPLALQVGVEMARGLHYAHTRLDEDGRPLHIIHRDVSPQNVVLSYEGQVKLVDFGIAKARTAGRQNTEAGAVKGKYVYFAPEQVRGQPLDARVDVFATGVVLYELLCGRLPFEGPMADVLRRISQGQYPPPRLLNPDIPASLERVLRTALATEREQRYATAQALQEALAAELHAHSRAHPLPGDALGSLMGYLFEPELVAEGRPVQLPRDFLSLVERARRLPPAPLAPDEETTQEATPPGGVALPAPLAPGRRPGWRWRGRGWALVVPAGAALAAGAAVVGALCPRTTEVSLTSAPAGATVVVDGSPAPTPTPVLIRNLRADRPHRLELRVPGRTPWVRDVPPTRERRMRLHAVLTPALPDGASFPSAPFVVSAAQHVLGLGPAALRVALEPGRVYRARLEAPTLVGARPGAPTLPVGAGLEAPTPPVLYVLEEGADRSASVGFGVLGPEAAPLPRARALWLLRVDGGQTPVKVRLQDDGGEGRLYAVPAASAPPGGFRLEGLDPRARYTVRAREGGEVGPAAPGPAPLSGTGRHLLLLSGRPGSPPSVQVLTVDHPAQLSGATWARFAFPDLPPDAPALQPGSVRVEVRELPLSVGGPP